MLFGRDAFLRGRRDETLRKSERLDALPLPTLCMYILDETPAAKSVILSAMKEWEQSSCLKFVRRTTEENYIAFFKGNG